MKDTIPLSGRDWSPLAKTLGRAGRNSSVAVAIPRARYAKRDGKTSRLRAMDVNGFIDFAEDETNRVRVMAQRLRPKTFRTRTFRGDDGWFLRVWRIA